MANPLTSPRKLEDHCVDLWLIPLEPPGAALADDAANVESWLTAAEMQTSAKRLRPADRLVYRRSHAALRAILGEYVGRSAAMNDFVLGPHQKPGLASCVIASHGPLEFNLSHSGTWATVAVSRRPVGVDIERQRPLANLEGMTRRWCSVAEQMRLAPGSVQQRTQVFFECWTSKEALLKAIGCGVAGGISQVTSPEYTAHAWQAWRAPADLGGGAWRCRGFTPEAGYLGAVVVEPQVERLELCNFAWAK
ncbi:MAG: 4'-phosphopantetheinyl transferase superfamily protein [Planctomycetales bacterium]|nr:4'-phosphopantetheinyl transferase superfamily protein [Planctomycetales bacterium]